MKTMKLTQQLCVTVDIEDFDELSKFKWYAVRNKRNYYAARRETLGYRLYRTVFMHRQIMGVNDKSQQVDHLDHNGLNNCRNNLRVVTPQQNQMRKRSAANSTSKYVGVSFIKERNKWQAQIMVNRKRIGLGQFNDEIEAAKAYNEAAIKHFGNFAFPLVNQI